MGARSKLALGLAAEKGVDIAKVKEKRRLKALHKKKDQRKNTQKANGEEEQPQDDDARTENERDEEDSEAGGDEKRQDSDQHFDPEDLNDSSSDSEVEMEERIERPPRSTKRTAIKAANAIITSKGQEREDEEREEDEVDEDIPMSDIEELDDDDREDLIPHSRLTINNTSALLTSLNRIRIPVDSAVAFATHQSVYSPAPTADAIPEVSDDLQRELQFYKQSRDAVLKARTLLSKEGVPFSRPADVCPHLYQCVLSPVNAGEANKRVATVLRRDGQGG
jgi:rRNA-processing protein EBP2